MLLAELRTCVTDGIISYIYNVRLTRIQVNARVKCMQNVAYFKMINSIHVLWTILLMVRSYISSIKYFLMNNNVCRSIIIYG